MHRIDPTNLLETRGRVDRFLINPHDDADGFFLEHGFALNFSPHMSDDVFEMAMKDVDGEVSIKQVLNGRKGEKRSGLFRDLADIGIQTDADEELNLRWEPGHNLAGRGDSSSYGLGNVSVVDKIGEILAKLTPVDLVTLIEGPNSPKLSEPFFKHKLWNVF